MNFNVVLQRKCKLYWLSGSSSNVNWTYYIFIARENKLWQSCSQAFGSGSRYCLLLLLLLQEKCGQSCLSQEMRDSRESAKGKEHHLCVFCPWPSDAFWAFCTCSFIQGSHQYLFFVVGKRQTNKNIVYHFKGGQPPWLPEHGLGNFVISSCRLLLVFQ